MIDSMNALDVVFDAGKEEINSSLKTNFAFAGTIVLVFGRWYR
jgi:hypothetical protein